LRAEEFDLSGGSSTVGPISSQSSASRSRTWFVAPEHPGATMLVEHTGTAALGWIVLKSAGQPAHSHHPTKFPRHRPP